MTRSAKGTTKRRPSGPSGKHVDPRRKLSAPERAWRLWDEASEHALDDSWADWARNVLTIAAAEELGIDPVVALGAARGRPT